MIDTSISDPHMSGAIIPQGSVALAGLVERATKTLEDAVPVNTRRAYEGDLRRFVAWCNAMGLAAMPTATGTIVTYMRALADAGKKVSTIQRALAAICDSNARAGHPSLWTHPAVADMRAALRRELGVRPNAKRAADDDVLRHLLAVVPTAGLLGLRDRALVLLAWCGAFRRSELVALDVADISTAVKGLVVLVRRSKSDQEGLGAETPIFHSNDPVLCPVRALAAWLEAAEIAEGPLFRQVGRRQRLGVRLAAATVRDRVRHWCKVAGLPFNDFAAHSLRSGFVTTAARRGKDLDAIMRTTRHRSERVARAYIQRANPHQGGAGEGLL
jgi:site-specific recombinase XerD